MRTISSEEFIEKIKRNPAWCLTIKKEIAVKGVCNMKYSFISHLSTKIHFLGGDDKFDSKWNHPQRGIVADFEGCLYLKEASGTFHGSVYFSHSGVEKISELKIIKGDEYGHSASFVECQKLKAATGTFPNFVSFQGAGIKEIKDLYIKDVGEHLNIKGKKANFSNCKNLEEIPKEINNNLYFIDNELKQKNIRRSIKRI